MPFSLPKLPSFPSFMAWSRSSMFKIMINDHNIAVLRWETVPWTFLAIVGERPSVRTYGRAILFLCVYFHSKPDVTFYTLYTRSTDVVLYASRIFLPVVCNKKNWSIHQSTYSTEREISKFKIYKCGTELNWTLVLILRRTHTHTRYAKKSGCVAIFQCHKIHA